MKRYFLYGFSHQDQYLYCLVDSQTATRTAARTSASEIFINKSPCIYPMKLFTSVYDSIANADSIEELLYENPELFL